MSHYTTLRTQLTDADALVAALADLGYPEVEVHDEAQPLRGYLGDLRAQRAHVIVRRRHVGRESNDLGFERRADGRFVASISDHDRPRHGEDWLRRLTARHAYHATKATLGAQGFDLVEEETDRTGTVRLVLRRAT